MRFDVLSLFPDFIRQAAEVGVVGRGIERGLLSVRPGTRAITPPAATAAWMTAHSAAARAA